MSDVKAKEVIADAGELAERLRTVQGRLGEFRGRL
jgi:hypothetical protein